MAMLYAKHGEFKVSAESLEGKWSAFKVHVEHPSFKQVTLYVPVVHADDAIEIGCAVADAYSDVMTQQRRSSHDRRPVVQAGMMFDQHMTPGPPVGKREYHCRNAHDPCDRTFHSMRLRNEHEKTCHEEFLKQYREVAGKRDSETQETPGGKDGD